jgi:uncharacterized membrane protein
MKDYLVYIMGLFYVAAGINHFWQLPFYTKMIANFLPCARQIVYVSGLAEIMLGIGVCFPETRKVSAIGIIALLILVFPANINMALHPGDWKFSPLTLYLRLPVQLILIYWAYLYT